MKDNAQKEASAKEKMTSAKTSAKKDNDWGGSCAESEQKRIENRDMD